MNKEFIPYKQALELKELGFDEPCFFAFDHCSTPMRCTDLRTSEQRFNGVNYNSSTYTSQPTFSQAFRWFREKHYFVGTILGDGFNGDLKGYYYSITEKGWINFYESIESGKWYDTYEEAELECLKKLIEIVKNK